MKKQELLNRDDLTGMLRELVPGEDWAGQVHLSSLDRIVILSALYERYGIALPFEELRAERFSSARDLYALLLEAGMEGEPWDRV